MSRVPLPYLDPQNESLSLLIANPKSWNVTPCLGSWPEPLVGIADYWSRELDGHTEWR